MGRKASRKHAFSIIYQLPFHDEFDASEAAGLYLAQINDLTEEDGEFIAKLVEGTIEHLEELNGFVERHAVGWAFERIASVDLAIMRIAIFEMLYHKDVPVSVVINEAVELAKAYGSDESAAFVNGLLAQVAKLAYE